MAGYKVRLGDGSEIGPLDHDMVRTWYQQGLIGPESPVMKPGSKRWTRLDQAFDLKQWGGFVDATARRRRSAGPGSRPGAEPSPPSTGVGWRTVTAGVLFFLVALGAGFAALQPERWIPDLDGTPWLQIALVQLAFGLSLIRGWELGRKIVRIALLLIALAAFPLAGILLAQGVRGRALLVLLSACVLLSGFFVFLAASLSWPKTALSLLVLLAGGAGVGYFGLATETAATRAVREWTAAERRFADEAAGLTLDLPPSWVLLLKDNPLVAAPPGARLTMAHRRMEGFGFLLVEPPRGASSLEQYADRFVAERRRALPSLQEAGRQDAWVGRLPARKVTATWESGGVRFRETTLVWKDGWACFALTAWVPEATSARGAREVDALLAGASATGALSARLQQAVQRVTEQVPLLSPAAAEMLMLASEPHVLEPEEALRRTLAAIDRGLGLLPQSEAQEYGAITAAAWGSVPRNIRPRLTGYLDRARSGPTASPQEDREMGELMKAAVLELPPAQRGRLQALCEKALGLALAGS